MAALVDTNVLVYRVNPRFPQKQKVATEVLRQGIIADDIRVPHQAVVEFFAAVSRPLQDGKPILTLPDAILETESILTQFVILFPGCTGGLESSIPSVSLEPRTRTGCRIWRRAPAAE